MSKIASSGFYKTSQRIIETETALDKSPKFTICVIHGGGAVLGTLPSNFLVGFYHVIVGVLGKFGSLENYVLMPFELVEIRKCTQKSH